MVDELNTLKRAIPYEEYFGEMELDEEEIKKRIELAKRLEPNFLIMFALVGQEKAEDLTRILSNLYKNTVSEFENDVIEPESYMDLYIDDISKSIVDTTILHEADDYYQSMDRAMFISENESNSVSNYYQQINAIKDGKTMKRWITMRDSKVRHSHKPLDGNTVGIFESFKVGNSRMLFPCDASLGASPEQIVNCRCSLKYI